MVKLQELIVQEFGEMVLGIVDPFERGWMFPLTDVSFNEIKSNIDSIIDLKKIGEVRHLAKLIHNEGKGNQNTDNDSLAARLCTHDLMGRFALYLNVAGQMNESPKYKNNQGEIKDLVTFIILSRTIGLAMAYLSSDGDPRYVTKIPTSQLDYIWPGAPSGRDLKINSVDSITNIEYTVIQQFIRNAKTRPQIQMQKEQGYLVTIVSDNGMGILDEEERQIQKGEIGKIFGNFTTKHEGGTGLIVADRLAQLSGGYIELISVTEGNPAIVYNTRTKRAIEMHVPFQHGARFTLFTPANL